MKWTPCLAFLLAPTIGCGAELPPAGQFVVYVTTDAPVAPRDGAVGPSDRVPLFDTVRFDLQLSEGSLPCEECVRAFGVDAEQMGDGEVSIGVVPGHPDRPGILRVRLYWSEVELGPQPSAGGSLDAWIELPPIDEEGIVELTVALPTESVGTTMGSETQPSTAQHGKPNPDYYGSWEYAERVRCAELPPANQACVLGGAFWMGHPRFGAVPAIGWEADARRIVVLDPFYVDVAEVTVAEFRASALAQRLRRAADAGPVEWNGETPQFFTPAVRERPAFCTYTQEPGERDELPVNCVSRELAAAYCQQQGGELPSEAQLEYLMGGRLGTAYAWGRDDPTCDEAVWGRAFRGQSAGDGSCRLANNASEPAAPLPPGSGSRDSVSFGGVLVVDLTGNVSEWARDAWSRQGERCWQSGVEHNPTCLEASPFDEPSAPCKGGNWTEVPSLLHTAKRWALKKTRYVRGPCGGPEGKCASYEGASLFDLAQIGFRCARPAPKPDADGK